MSVASKVGGGLGKVVGWSAATAWKGACLTVAASGEFGEAAYEGTVDSFEAQCAAIDASVEARRAKAAACKAAILAARQEPSAKSKKAVAA